jgi:hypothetical protein
MGVSRQLLARARKALLVPVDRGDKRARSRQVDGDSAADATAATCHHADAARQTKPIR